MQKMWSILVALSIFILTITASLLVLWWYQNYSRHFTLINKIPGPPVLPIVGHLYDYVTTPEKIFASDRDKCSKYFPIFKISILHKSSVGLLCPEDIEIILSSSKHIKKSQIYDILHIWLGTGLLTSDGDKWRMRRKLLTPAFHFNILQDFVGIFNKSTLNLLTNLEEVLNGSSVNLFPIITDFTLESMAETAMGSSLDLKSESSNKYRRALYEFGEISLYRVHRPWMYLETFFKFTLRGIRACQVVKTLRDFTDDIIKQKKEARRRTSYSTYKKLAMLDLLLKSQDEGFDIDDEGIREEVDTFMFEGHDTTSVAICFMLMLLANNREIQDQVYEEIVDVLPDTQKPPSYANLQDLQFTERCIKECLRLYPSVPMIGRDINEEIHTFTGYTIPKGSMVHIFIYDLHRHPEIYPDPLKFDPDRFLPDNIKTRHPFAYIPFSAGPRNCIGQRFAILELKALLCGLLRKYVLEPVDTPESIVFKSDMVLRTDHPVRVKFIRRAI